MARISTRGALVSIGVVIGVVVLVALVARPQLPPPELPFRHTFDQTPEAWLSFGEGAQVRLTRNPDHVKVGTAALELEYEVGPGRSGSAVLPLTRTAFAHLGALRFWIKSDLDTSVGVVLSEAPPGGDYSAWFWAARDTWQHVELFPSDFTINEGPGDRPDPNGRLDLDRLQALGLINIGQFFGHLSEDPNYPLVLNRPSGTHYLHVDEFEALPADGTNLRSRPRLIGDPERGLISWITLGGAELSIGTRNPLDGPAYEATYEQTPGKYVLLAHGLGSADLERADRLSLQIASRVPATMVVYLEERSPGHSLGPRYSTALTLTGGSRPEQKIVLLSEFVHDATGPADPDGRLDAGRLKSISLVDVTAATSGRTERNTLWWSGIEPLAP